VQEFLIRTGKIGDLFLEDAGFITQTRVDNLMETRRLYFLYFDELFLTP